MVRRVEANLVWIGFSVTTGRQPPGLTLESLMHAPMPMLWSEQAEMIESLAATGTPGVAPHRLG